MGTSVYFTKGTSHQQLTSKYGLSRKTIINKEDF